ncbi:hypothetical protein AMS68_004212 [Peltaster fructicola]|uniref:Uncharacterized protein n=1 Tax=Peltaster fructicola TaxID=286661 RepID=A0A6H0XVL3_9PEZI|nr:hypothetical protein AMS68_004212 [Peltaster fructicola]
MNCPSRVEALPPDHHNQNPNALSADLTTRSDLGSIANARRRNDHRIDSDESPIELIAARPTQDVDKQQVMEEIRSVPSHEMGPGSFVRKTGHVLKKYVRFIGPGFLVSVAYIDPGNYATDVAAGASYRFQLLFVVLISNLFAILLQSLCIKLGSITGMNLAEMIKAHCPRWLNYIMYFLAECAIIATDIAEVIGTAIALNLLLKIPLVAGVALSIVDVLVILLFYSPNGTMRGLRAFECFVIVLVLGVVICFCYQLSFLRGISAGDVFRGYLPSAAVVQGTGLYQSCGILGATVMPHSLFLGSGLIQARLKEFDTSNKTVSSEEKYRPSIFAIRSCMSYSIAELVISLFTFALFVNSAILIVAGGSLYENADAGDADLFGIYDLLAQTLAPIAGTVFALALLFSGTSAGIVCTIAGQMVSEGHLNWTVRPWIRRLITRSISITPSIIVAGALGAEGISAALTGSQVALSVLLPFLSAPVIYFTCRNKFMTVHAPSTVVLHEGLDAEAAPPVAAYEAIKMRNHWITAGFAIAIWLCIVVMNVALIVLVAMGLD